jgi:hypothetical protein
MEPFRSSNFSEPNTGSEPFHALGMELFHSVLPGSRTEHISLVEGATAGTKATTELHVKAISTNKIQLSPRSCRPKVYYKSNKNYKVWWKITKGKQDYKITTYLPEPRPLDINFQMRLSVFVATFSCVDAKNTPARPISFVGTNVGVKLVIFIL